jgi:hypothetical protein
MVSIGLTSAIVLIRVDLLSGGETSATMISGMVAFKA